MDALFSIKKEDLVEKLSGDGNTNDKDSETIKENPCD